MSKDLIKLVDEAHSDCDDEYCLVLFGIILDSASKVRREAEKRFKQLDMERT